MAGYRVHRVSAAALIDRAQLAPVQLAVATVHVLAVPTGAAIALAFGTGELVPVFPGFVASFCPAELGGVAVSVTATGVGDAIVLVWSDAGGSSQAPA